jgi:hypothetical protein
LIIITGLGQWGGSETKFKELIFLLRSGRLHEMYKRDNVKAYCQFLRYIVSNIVGMCIGNMSVSFDKIDSDINWKPNSKGRPV